MNEVYICMEYAANITCSVTAAKDRTRYEQNDLFIHFIHLDLAAFSKLRYFELNIQSNATH